MNKCDIFLQTLCKSEKKILIYGAGTYGKNLMLQFMALNREDNIEGFAVSGKPVIDSIFNKQVKCINDYCGDFTVLIATTIQYKQDIISILQEKGFCDFIYVGSTYELEFEQTFEKETDYNNQVTEYLKKESIEDKYGYIVSHVTYAVCLNAGDTMLSKCVRKSFECKLKIKKWNIYDISKVPDQKSIDKINKSDFLVIGGGGLFLPDTNPNTLSGWQWAISKELLNKITVPIIVYAVGYNYFDGQENTSFFEDNVRLLIEKAFFVGLRNQGSVKKIQKIVSNELAYKVYYQPCPTTLTSRLFHIERKKRNKSVAVNMAFDRSDRRFGNHPKEILTQVAKALNYISRKGYSIIYVMHCVTDNTFIPYLSEQKMDFTIMDLSHSFPEEIMNFYSSIETVIGMRGHAQMIPFGVNCRMISLGSHRKMKWFLQDVNLLELYVDMQENIDRLSCKVEEIFDYLCDNEIMIEKKIEKKQEELWEITERNLEFIEKNLNKSYRK